MIFRESYSLIPAPFDRAFTLPVDAHLFSAHVIDERENHPDAPRVSCERRLRTTSCFSPKCSTGRRIHASRASSFLAALLSRACRDDILEVSSIEVELLPDFSSIDAGVRNDVVVRASS